ncbi:uncharacterized protein LOC124139343 [Haliotis rufescens]|uniref:uncharacterized protein LOC124139343 n=1 Tax=Haliotis rufescens TaxID=6454 RepID=UPI00201EF1CE|nr:uncharacterized protein LOC124139343 [Haliotis rufescens]
MSLPTNINLCIYIATIWGTPCVDSLMKHARYRRFSDAIAIANTTTPEWVSDLFCLVDTLIENRKTSLTTPETIQCFTNRAVYGKRSLWKIVPGRKVIHRTHTTKTPLKAHIRQKNGAHKTSRKPARSAVRESKYSKSSFILIFDIPNKIVYKLKEGKHYTKYVLPTSDRLVDIEFSVKEGKVLWVGQWKIMATRLKSNLNANDISPHRWLEQDGLRMVRRDSSHTFLLTDQHIYKSSYHYSSRSRKDKIANIVSPSHAQLDEKHRYIYWTEHFTYMAKLKVVPYSGGKPRTITSVKVMQSFTITEDGFYLFYCGPKPRFTLMHNLKKDKKYSTITDECIGVANGDDAQLFLTSRILVTVPRKGKSSWHSFPTIHKGGVKYIK